jgi:ABC-type nitrate/sulfonate/bicarbonate transport system substrate-binding protein
MRALHRAARWCQDPANRTDLAAIMEKPGHLGLPAATQMPILTGRLDLGGRIVDVADFYLPFDKAANFPLEESCALVLQPDGALGRCRSQPGLRRNRARLLPPRLV